MEARIEFEGNLVPEYGSKIVERVEGTGYWSQDFEIHPTGLSLTTYSGKGVWSMEVVEREYPEVTTTVVSFQGYRNSFADGTCAFRTCELPWTEAEIIGIDTSNRERPVEVYMGHGRMLQLPWIGPVDLQNYRVIEIE